MKDKISVVVLLCALAAGAGGGWKSETVASEGDVGAGCSLAVDRWGRPHISFIDKTQGKVMYALYTGSSWGIEAVASDVTVTGGTALALDAFDKPHVLFHDDEKEELTYAYQLGSIWRTEKVAAGAHYGIYLSINAWPTDPRVSYDVPVGMSSGLKYGYRDTEGWHTETVVSSGGGPFNTLFDDSAGRPNVIYWHFNSLSIRHAVRKSGEWVIDDIAEGIDCDAFVGPADKVHVSFPKVNNKGLNYAVSTAGGSWDIENVLAAKGLPGYSQICVNAAGDVFISYFDFDKFDLHIVTKKGSSWTHEVVATGGYVGAPHSPGLGIEGHPLIAYYDADNGDLKLARYVTDVELTSFTGQRSRGGVEIRWTVDDAREVAGYNLYRSAAGADREKVNAALVEGVSPFRYRDDDAQAEVGYKYWLEAVALSGTTVTFGPVSVPPANNARAFALHQNVPNPCAGATIFTFELAEAAEVTFALYDMTGRKVGELAKGYYVAGRHEVCFDATLTPGVYVYRLDAGDKTAARKMVVAR